MTITSSVTQSQHKRNVPADLCYAYQRVVAEHHNGNVYISKKHINKIFELLELGNQEAIEELLARDKAERLPAKDFSPAFIRDLGARRTW